MNKNYARNLAIVGALLVAVGCKTNHQKQASMTETSSAPAYGAVTPAPAATSLPATTSVDNSKFGVTQAPGATDSAVASQFKQSLNADPALAPIAPSLRVSVENGTMILSGAVPSQEEKQRIETLAQSTSGVLRVENQLQVNLAPADTISQSTHIYSNSTDQAFGTAQTPVNNQNLSPTSDRLNSTNRVYGANSPETATTSIPRDESFKVKVQGDNASDKSLAEQIRETLRTVTATSPLTSTVNITLENGKATLTGTVKNEETKNKLESAIQQISGVTSVDNQLEVNPTAAGTANK